jgi:dihydropteroate synthase
MKHSSPNFQFTTRGKGLDTSAPKVMGILNATPDSFSDGGEYNEVQSAIQRIEQMISQGASIIDIGGESTRPGSDPVAEQKELDRVLPIIEKAVSAFPNTYFSIDTTKYRVADEALKRGVHFVNDISGMQTEPRLVDLCVEYDAGYIMMHSQGNPKTMQDDPTYDNVVDDIYRFFEQQLAKARKKGLQNIIIDPGIGFGKTLDHNLKLIANLDAFQKLGCPILVGASRKSMIGTILGDRPVEDRVTGSVAVHFHAMMQGANIIRVHDVKEAHDSLLVFNAISDKKITS